MLDQSEKQAPMTSVGTVQATRVARAAASPTPSIQVIISGTGSYIPAKVLTNEGLTAMVDTSDEWIFSRTGIRERRIAGELETTSEMAFQAAAAALKKAGISSTQVDLLIIATITPDMLFPSTACLVQNKLGLRSIPAFDVEAACSGFLYILDIAASMLQSGRFRHALVIGSEKLSSILDWTDRTTCVLFGDGAGAAVLSRTDENTGFGIIDSVLGADGEAAGILAMPAGGSLVPASLASLAARQHFLKMNGKEVFKIAVRVMEKAAKEILEKNNLRADQIACIIPHQANLRIIEMLSSRMGVPLDRFYINLQRLGNTSAASVPLALDEAVAAGKVRSGDLVVLVAFGAGLTWGATLIRWH